MSTPAFHDVFVTGLGVVCPLGMDRAAIWNALEAGTSGVCEIAELAEAGWIAPFGGVVKDFDPKAFVKPRKSLKVMCREMQFTMAAADLAWDDSALGDQFDPERAGIVAGSAGQQFCDLAELRPSYLAWRNDPSFDFDRFPRAAIEELFPLWMLKYLPNLNACHVGIRRDIRGPTNTVSVSHVSGLLAVAEAAEVIRRGTADVMLAGGAASFLSHTRTAFHRGARLAGGDIEPSRACRPFDRDRRGMVYGEGAAYLVLESRAHAQARGAKSLARIAGAARRCEPSANDHQFTGVALRRAIEAALQNAGVAAQDIGHVNAHGNSTREDDPVEAQAIRESLGDVPVTAPKSYFGNLNATSGLVELAVSLIGLQRGFIPPTLNYETPDDACPVNVVTRPQATTNRTFVAVNHAPTGQAVAVVVDQA